MRNNPEDVGMQVLLASGDAPYASTLAHFLETEGYHVQRCHDARGVLRLVGRNTFGTIVLDMELDEESDLDLVTYIRRQTPDTQLILIVEIAKLEKALAGIRRGAFFYLPKSSAPSDVALAVNKARRNLQTQTAIQDYEQDLFQEFIGDSKAMKRVIEVITKVAPTDSTVLILGESGTGKEIIANAVHRLSRRREMPFIAVNCAALPEQLLESEMFGHLKGAFTGADSNKRGLFEEADGGTIFLDEVGEMSLATQAKLLRVLQNGEIRPVGASSSSHVDVRVLAATNRNLEEAVAERRFREDLYFRLNVIQVRVPPLRERMDALPQLVGHFVSQMSRRFGKRVQGFDEQTQAYLRNYSYPGNVRELESIIAHAIIMADGDIIRARDLPEQVRAGGSAPFALPHYASESIPTLKEMEEQLIRQALDKLSGNQTEAADKLGISRSTLWRKMKEYGIRAD
ncbi:MAG TPA: sigma-54 dependent transcriptional regulator [Candidatus Hydrogenedentes bacterium]|nr:sigma-54 dependent transcriptional regulator [Candidatus Hydrogenedentota bacterium]